MTFRRVLTALLLLFVAASTVVLVDKELRGKPVPGKQATAVAPGSSGTDRQVVAFYFTGKVRCSSCRRIEQVSRNAIERYFPRELGAGQLRFLVVDFDEPENRHFVEDYRLDSSALVLVDRRAGRQVAWKNLRDVWPLVEDEPKLETYVRDEVAAMLKGL